MVALDGDRGPACRGQRLYHIGIERPLHQEPDVVAHLARLGLEHVDERVADTLALGLGIGDAGQRTQELPAGINHPEVDAEMLSEGLLHLFPLVEPEQPVVHEDAGETVSHGAMDQRRGHRGVNAARESANNPCRRINGFLDSRDFALNEVARGPVRMRATDAEDEVGEDLSAPRGVGHLGMKLHPIQRLRLVLDGGDRGVGAPGHDSVSWRRHVHMVAVAHPGRCLLARLESLEQYSVTHRHHCPAVLPPGRPDHVAAAELGHQLHAVADPQHRNAQFQQGRIRRGNVLPIYRIRST